MYRIEKGKKGGEQYVATVSSRRIEMVGYNLERNDQTVSASSSVYLGGGLVVVLVYLTSQEQIGASLKALYAAEYCCFDAVVDTINDLFNVQRISHHSDCSMHIQPVWSMPPT